MVHEVQNVINKQSLQTVPWNRIGFSKCRSSPLGKGTDMVEVCLRSLLRILIRPCTTHTAFSSGMINWLYTPPMCALCMWNCEYHVFMMCITACATGHKTCPYELLLPCRHLPRQLLIILWTSPIRHGMVIQTQHGRHPASTDIVGYQSHEPRYIHVRRRNTQ